jgi:hypothetical protein
LASDKELRHKSIERGLFERFCGIKPFEIVEGTLTQPPPAAPDISVDLVGDGTVGFELVCIDEVSHIRGLNLMPESARLITAFHEQLPSEARAAFDERYGDTLLRVQFVDTAGQRGVRRSLPLLFDALMDLPTGLTGRVLSRGARVDGVHYVHIVRDESFKGPEFNMDTGGLLTGLNIGALEAKLGKTYEFSGPVDLLAYAMEISRQSDDESIKALIDARMPASSYRKVWVFEHMLRQAVCHHRPSAS